MYGTKVPLETIRAAFATETEWDPFYAAFETLKLRGDTDFMIDTLRPRLATPQRSETIKRLALLKPSPRVAGILLAELKRNLAKQTGYETVSRHVGKEVDGHFEGRWILTPSDNEDLVNALAELADLAPLVRALVSTHGGLAAGAHVQLWLRMDEPDTFIDVGLRGYCGTGDQYARLNIEWY